MNIILFMGCSLNVGNTRLFQFRYEVAIESTEGKKLEVWLPIPKSNKVQTISNLDINTSGLEYTIEDEGVHNNKYLYIHHKLGTSNSKKVIITFNVLRKEHQNINYQDVDPQNYLGAYSSVPIGGMFDKVISDNNLSKVNIRGIYNYVLEGMHYGKPKSVDNKYYHSPWLSGDGKYGVKEVGRDDIVKLYKEAKKKGGDYTFGNGNSVYACDIGVGNCTDYHSYFMSLDRTMGIPTRFHMGFPIPDANSGRVDGYHCWADYYVEDEGWYPVDISEADKRSDKADYFFGTVCSNRLEMMVGRDFILKGYEPQIVNLFIYPIIEVNDKQSFAYTKIFTYKDL